METDLKRIAALAKERDDENWDFRSFLKQHDLGDRELDNLVHKINDEVSSQIDCTKCANCCKQIRPSLDEADISTFASGLNVPVSQFKEEYIRLDEHDASQQLFKGLPCPFLRDDRCSNYDYRPTDCRSYPHLHKDSFRSRLWGVVDNYSICPIVFNVYERLKDELWYIESSS